MAKLFAWTGERSLYLSIILLQASTSIFYPNFQSFIICLKFCYSILKILQLHLFSQFFKDWLLETQHQLNISRTFYGRPLGDRRAFFKKSEHLNLDCQINDLIGTYRFLFVLQDNQLIIAKIRYQIFFPRPHIIKVHFFKLD